MKRFLIILVCVGLFLACGFAAAEEYVFDYDNYAISQYGGTDAELIVPNEVDGCPVESISASVFYNNDSIRSIVLPETLLELGHWNIGDMDALQSVSLPESLVAIDSTNFSMCHQLTEVRIPAGVSYIGGDCFVDCKSLKAVHFAGPVPGFGAGCFEFMPEDFVVVVPDDQLEAYRAALPAGLNVQPSGENAIVVDYTASEDEFTMEMDTGTILAYHGFATRVDIPETIYGVDVRAIGENAFAEHRYLYYVTIPEGVEKIGDSAFANTWHLAHVELPETLREIGSCAFRYFKGNSIALPKGLERIGESAFDGALLKGDLVLPDGMRTIEKYAFLDSGFESVYFPASIESIGEEAFRGWMCSYLCFDGSDLPQIAENAFSNQTIYDVDINWQASREQMLSAQEFFDGIGQSARVWRMQNPNVDYIYDDLDRYENGVMLGYDGAQSHIRPWDSYDGITVTALGDGAFKGNSIIRSFSVPYNDAFTIIGAEAFADSSIESIDLFDSVTTIGAGAFRNCVNLKEITIPESVVSLAADAFAGCTGLERIIFLCDPSVLSAGMLEDCTALAEVNMAPDADAQAQLALQFALYGMPEVTITRQPESVSVPEGEWAEVRVEAEGEDVSYAWYRMHIWENEFTLDEGCTENTYGMIVDAETDCTQVYCVVTDIYGTSAISDTASFYIEEEIIEPVPVGAEGEGYFGAWKGVSMAMDGVEIQFADIGMVMDISLNPDGTAVIFDGETEDVGVWSVSDGSAWMMEAEMRIDGEGRLCMDEDGMQMIFIRDGAQAQPSGDESSADGRLNQKYMAESFTASGQTMDASMLGAEYTLLFRDDGTMDFTLAGVKVENLPWSIDADGAFAIDQYGVIYRAVPTDAGFDLDFHGGMMLHFVPAQ